MNHPLFRILLLKPTFLKLTYLLVFITGEKKRVTGSGEPDYFEYTRGKKIPPEGLTGFDFSDPEQIIEFTK